MADCPICLEDITLDRATFPCPSNHEIHGRCLTQLITSFLENWNGGAMELPRCPKCRQYARRQDAQSNPHFRRALQARGNQLGVHVRGSEVTVMDHVGAVIGRNPNATMMALMLFVALLIMGAKWIAETGWKPGDPLK